MKNQYKRLIIIIILLSFGSIYSFFILANFRQNIEFFLSPSEVTENKLNKKFRVGGIIMKDSVKFHDNYYEFSLTDNKNSILVKYKGILPNLFREGQTIIAKGILENQIFLAEELLTKHDEYYIPRELTKKNNKYAPINNR